jgi:DNA-binding transcriptional regulator LsrR (DeoR family)
MAQPQGNSSTNSGRIGAEVGTAAVAAAFALGAGWGNTAAAVVSAGSNDQAGIVTVTSGGTGQAQATANVTFTFTFTDGAYASTPRAAIVTLMSSSNAVTEAQPTQGAVTTTVLSWRHSVLPVDTKTYKFSYLVIA